MEGGLERGKAGLKGPTEEAALPSEYFLRDDYGLGGMAQVSRKADPGYKLFNKDVLKNEPALIIYLFCT